MMKIKVKKYLSLKILEILSKGDKHGYAIAKEIFQNIGMKTSAGILYPMLRSLEKDGLIKSRKVHEGSRLKKVYTITDKGREILRNNETLIEEIRKFENKFREIKELGITELLMTLKRIYENLDSFDEKEKTVLKQLVQSFNIQLKSLIGELY
ncbi:MAG: PadR family transcriptional regulator [Thermosphaera sp.]